MAGTKISEATLRETLQGTENLPIVDSSLPAGRTTVDNIKDYILNDERITDIEDKVFPLSISVSGGGTFEKGVARNITVSWTVKKGDTTVTPDSVTINDNPATGTSQVFNDVEATTTYTVKATYQSKTVQASTKATFIAPMYFGFAANSEIAGLDITTLGKQSIKTTPNGTYNLNNGTTGDYLWLCVPNTMTINKVTSGGFDVPMESAVTGTTAVDTYKCYRSSSAINAGAMTIVIS